MEKSFNYLRNYEKTEEVEKFSKIETIIERGFFQFATSVNFTVIS